LGEADEEEGEVLVVVDVGWDDGEGVLLVMVVLVVVEEWEGEEEGLRFGLDVVGVVVGGRSGD
jgi:hypothetical protein